MPSTLERASSGAGRRSGVTYSRYTTTDEGKPWDPRSSCVCGHRVRCILMVAPVLVAIGATGLPCMRFSQGIEAGSSGPPREGGWGSALDGPAADLAAGCTPRLTARFAIGARDLVPTLAGNLNLNAFPVTKHDLEFVLEPPQSPANALSKAPHPPKARPPTTPRASDLPKSVATSSATTSTVATSAIPYSTHFGLAHHGFRGASGSRNRNRPSSKCIHETVPSISKSPSSIRATVRAAMI